MKEILFDKIDNKEIRTILVNIFLDEENGTPDNITPKGCLEVAMNGKKIWNKWRESFPPICYDILYENITDFSNIDFSNKNIDFSGFKFGSGAKFNFSRWERNADFFQSEWGDYCEFKGVSWGKRSTFSLAVWGDNCTFEGSFWDHDAIFENAVFGNNTDMSNTYWSEGIYFNGSNFGHSLNFNLSIWEENVSFNATGVSGLSNRNIINLKDDRTEIILKSTSYSNFKSVSFHGAIFNGFVHFENRDFKECLDFSPSISIKRIKRDSSHNAINVNGQLSYEDIKDKEIKTVFKKVPNFIGAKFTNCVSFRETIFPKPIGSEYAIIRYRHLKDLFSKQNATNIEQMFFKLEMKEEALKSKGTKKVLYILYEVLSDFGFSFKKPLIYLILSFLIFSLVYLYFSKEFCNIDNFKKVIDFNISYLVYGLNESAKELKNDFLCSEYKNSLLITFIMIFEKFLVFLLIFFMGLSLRNMFRIK